MQRTNTTNLGVIYTDDDSLVWIAAGHVPGVITINVTPINLKCDVELKNKKLAATEYFPCRYIKPHKGASLAINNPAGDVGGIPQPIILPAIPKATGNALPRFDITGKYNPPHYTEVVTIEKHGANGSQITWDFPLPNYDHHFVGNYVTPTTVVGIQTRTVRKDLPETPNGPVKAGCVLEMNTTIEVEGPHKLCASGMIAPGTKDNCDLKPNFSQKICDYQLR